MANCKFQLILKFCKCGCGMTWRALPTSLGEYWSKTHSKEKYEPWRTERSQFRAVRKWLVDRFGNEEEKESDQDRLNEISKDDLGL